MFLSLMALLSERIREFIHWVRQKRLPCMIAGMTIYAFNNTVVSGDATTVVWLSCLLLSVLSFLTLFSAAADLHLVLDVVSAACGSAALELGLKHEHPLQALCAVILFILCETVMPNIM